MKLRKEREEIIKLRERLKAFRTHTKQQVATLVTSAFGFVAALFWRDAIKSFVEQTLQVSPGEGPWAVQLGVALIVTIVAIIAIVGVSKTLGK